ncbi:hypothetical protein BV20DRAFT_973755 [Pilatotrama ljubarskyi]|nr:hypothetical protein BV20DRAFT_973755 [Pilatotrama ljubarskyi]
MKRLCPGSLQYAVICMDPVAMVEHLNDHVATAQARALCPKKYLVYLDNALDLSFPTSAWFRFQVSPIGTTLRPEDPARGVTSNMAIPIYPNEDHPAHRPPIRTQKPFPFRHCYHWVDNLTTVRIRRIPGLYDDAPAIKISSLQHIRMEKAFAEDCSRINAFVEARRAEAARKAEDDVWRLPPRSLSPASQDSRLSDELNDERDLYAPRQARSRPEKAPSGPRMNTSLEDLFRMDIFSLSHDPDTQFLPLVDLWFDLANHLSEDDIPSPLDFYEERKAIASIILDSRDRNLTSQASRRDGVLQSGVDGLTEEEDDLFMQTDDETDDEAEDEGSASAEEESPLQRPHMSQGTLPSFSPVDRLSCAHIAWQILRLQDG